MSGIFYYQNAQSAEQELLNFKLLSLRGFCTIGNSSWLSKSRKCWKFC